MTILVNVWMDRMGSVHAEPVSRVWRERFVAVVADNGGPPGKGVFFQEGGPAQEFLEGLSPRQRRDLEAGWSIRIKADPWVVGHWYGYDAHTAAEHACRRPRGRRGQVPAGPGPA